MISKVANATFLVGLLLFGCDDGPPKASDYVGRLTGHAEAVEQNIYVMGGMTLSTSIHEVGSYNSADRTWTQMASMPTARGAAASAVIGQDVYVVGGRNEGGTLSTCEKLVTNENRWEECASMPTKRWSLMMATDGEKLYAFGGISGVGNKRRALDLVEAYDPNTDSWKNLGKMPQVRQGAAVAAAGGKIYLVSGKVASYAQDTAGKPITGRVDSYDPVAKRWARVKDIPAGRVGSKAVVSNGLIYVVGGLGDGGEFPTTIDVFDPSTNTWSSGPNLSSGRSGHMAALAGDSIFVLGGMDIRYGDGRPSILNSMESVPISEIPN